MKLRTKRGRQVVGAACLLLLPMLLSCSDDDPHLDAASRAIERSADECLLSVRDRGTRYNETPACLALGSLAMGYIEATRGWKHEEPAQYRVRFISAQRMAWTALAWSETGDRNLRIW